MLRVELLKEEDVIGKDRLNIFDKIPIEAEATDVVSSQLPKLDKKAFPYWLNSYYEYFYYYSLFSGDYLMGAKYINHNGLVNEGVLDDKFGIRLKISYEDIKDEILKDVNFKDIYHKEHGVKVLKALEWPQTFVKNNSEEKEDLDILYDYNELRKSNKCFTIRIGECLYNHRYNSYDYKFDKYIKMGNNWAKVEPIEWYFDEEKKILVSKKIILANIYLANRFTKKNFFQFEKSNIGLYLNQIFTKESIMNDETKNLNIIPFGTSYDYDEILNKIYNGESFWNDRVNRKQWLNNLKKLLLEINNNEELKKIVTSGIIDKIIDMNSMDEVLIRHKYSDIEKAYNKRIFRKK